MKQIYAWGLAIIMFFMLGIKSVSAASDMRVVKMQVALEKYESPMAPYAQELVAIADQYNLDWTILAAIAGTESTFGKRMPYNCTNPYGWGIYGDNKLCFEDFAKAASAVAEGLSTRYNTTSLESIGATYNKVSTSSWVSHTRFFMNKIKNAEIPVASLPITL